MYASRAGAKLEFALDHFGLSPQGLICADLGCSTGGFTDCLLSRGAVRVYAVDTGYGVLDYKLRTDPRVVVRERTNALHVEFPEPVQFITVDVSWTPQRLIIPHALSVLDRPGTIVSLLKPHYEAPKQWLRRGVLPPERVPEVVASVIENLTAAGVVVKGSVQSPVTGEKGGNIEYLLWIQ